MNKVIPILLCCISAVQSWAQSLETVIQMGHELAVVAADVSPDSNFVATASKDKSIKLWELSTGREIRTFLGHEMSVTAVQFSSDGKYLISCSYDKSVRLWDVLTGKAVHVINGPDALTDVVFDPKMKFFVVGGYGQRGGGDSAVVYDLKTKQVLRKIEVDADKGRGHGISMAISPDGKWLGFGQDNRLVEIYSTSNWEKVHSFQYEEGWCGGCSTYLTFSPDNRFVYMDSYKGSFKKYDLTNGKLITTYEPKTEDLMGVAVSDDGKLIARSTEKNVTIFSEADGKIWRSLDAEDKSEFHKIVFLPGNQELLITSNNNTAFVWNFHHSKKEKVFTGYLNERDKGGLNYDHNFFWQSAIARYVRYKNTLLISKDGKSLIKGKFATKVKQWDIATGKSVMEFVGHKKAVLCYDLSTDGKKLLTGGGDGAIILWDMLTGDSLKVIRSYREPIFDIQFSSDETMAASSSWDASMKVHDLTTGKLQTYIEFESYAAYDILLHPNDLYLFAARLDHSLQLYELDTRSVVRSFIGHTDVISSTQLSTDKKTLMSTSWDGSIRLWDVSSGLMDQKFKVGSAVYTAAFSNDGKYVYSGSADRQIRIWEIATGKVVRTFSGHGAEITSLLFSPDDKMLISHSVDGVTKFWDLATGKEFFEHIHLGENEWMVKNQEGYFHGTDQARKYIHFVSGMKSYAVDQFFNDFYRPDLLPKIFQNRGSSSELKGVQRKLNSSPPPQIKIAVLPVTGGKAEVIVRMLDNGGGAENLKIYHNGKNIALDYSSLELPKAKGEATTYRHTVDLVGGNNIFSASAVNRDRIESDAPTAEIFSENTARTSTCHILSVGINQYKNPRMALNYAKPDADSFSKVMNDRGTNLFKSTELYTLYDEQATRKNILAKLDELTARIHPEDVFILYYAGHGSMVDNKFYFIPTETLRLYDGPTLHNEAIEAVLIQEKLKHIKALKQLIIMDACQSGGSVELLANRGASEEKAIAQLSRSAGIHVMASAGSEQFAAEFTELGHGLFTYVLIRALQGEADGAPKDGKVTIYELKSYIDDQVPELTRKLKGKPQYPYTFSRGQDFPVVID